MSLFVTTPFAIFRPFNPENNKVIMCVLRFFMYFLCGIRLHSEGNDILEQTRPSVAITNHQHNLDAGVVAGFFSKRLVILGKYELIFVPYFGQIYMLFGNLVIKRGNRRESLKSMALLEKRIVEEDLSVLVFPEGTRNTNEELLPFKKGAYLTAIKTQTPLVPISISQYKAKNQLGKIGFMEVYMKVHEPIPTAGLTKDDIPRLIEQSRIIINDGIIELNRKYL